MIPEFKSKKFKCPNCKVVSQQRWFDSQLSSKAANSIIDNVFYEYRSSVRDYTQDAIKSFIEHVEIANDRQIRQFIPSKFAISTCQSCNDISVWVDAEMIYPRKTPVDPPNDDMDEDIKALYLEAATIFTDSPKGSTAILRLALQKLLKQIGKKGKNINNDIKELVSEGLSPKIQQALDLLRVIGNNAVHPGQIDLDDNKDVALKLFHILNFISEEMITKPKELDFLYSDLIPDDTKEHIKQRDAE
jgi:hypothetical protein